MTNKESVDQDLSEYFKQEENMSLEDRRAYLRAIYDKHFIFTKLEFLVKYTDVQMIISLAKDAMASQKLPVSVSNKRIETHHHTTLAMLEAVVNYLSGNNLLKRIVRIDYKE